LSDIWLWKEYLDESSMVDKKKETCSACRLWRICVGEGH
jgi:radical SAM protein with 4Fe4S-binding SPASM domain